MAHRDISDAESINGDEFPEPPRRNSPSDPTSTEIEDHVLTGHASFPVVCPACVQGRGRAERHRGEGHKELEDGSKIPRRGITVSLGPRIEPTRFEVEQRGDSPVLVMHDGVTKSIFAQLIPAKGLDFAKL